MTTTTERLDRATHQHQWTEELRRAHAEAREQLQKAAAETAGELRAFADFLNELDVPGLEALADDLIGERMIETQEWVVPKFPDAIEPTAVIPAPDGPLLEWLNQGPADDENRPGRGYYEVAREMSGDPHVHAAVDRAEQQERGWIPRRPDVILGELYERTAPEDEPVLLALGTEATHIRSAPPDDDHGPVDRWLERTEQRLRRSRFGRWLAERFTPVKEEQ